MTNIKLNKCEKSFKMICKFHIYLLYLPRKTDDLVLTVIV